MCIRDRDHYFRTAEGAEARAVGTGGAGDGWFDTLDYFYACLLYTSDAADERSSVDLGGRRFIKKKKTERITGHHCV